MKKKFFGSLAVVAILLIYTVAAFNISIGFKDNNIPVMSMENVEAIAGCEITKNGKVVLNCSGGGKCSTTYMGYTLTCDGTKN
jgi:hypothetical protein